MKRGSGRSIMRNLQAYFASESPEVCDRLASRIAEYVVEQAVDGHFGYFELVLDLVDRKLHRTAEDEMTFGPDFVFVLEDDRQALPSIKAA